MVRKSWLVSALGGAILTGCVRVPTGPNVTVLPGAGKNFDQFVSDDAVCRDWARRQIGVSPDSSATATAATGAAAGTVLGAAAGAVLGAATGRPAEGAAVGAGAVLLGGSVVGAGNAGAAQATMQGRYDSAYVQCMYAKGNQVPGAAPPPRGAWGVPPPRAAYPPPPAPPAAYPPAPPYPPPPPAAGSPPVPPAE